MGAIATILFIYALSMRSEAEVTWVYSAGNARIVNEIGVCLVGILAESACGNTKP